MDYCRVCGWHDGTTNIVYRTVRELGNRQLFLAMRDRWQQLIALSRG